METVVEVTPAELTNALVEMNKKEIAVVTAADRIAIGEDLTANKTYQKKVKDYFGPLKKNASKVHKDICAKEKALLLPAMSLEQKQKNACIAYETEQERLRKVEQARLEVEARQRNEKAREAEAEALQAEAEAAEKAGDKAGAEAIIEEAAEVETEPVYTPPVIAPKIVPKVDGQSFSTTYKAEVFDITALLKAVISGRAPAMSIMVNQVFLNQTARSMKETMNLPGVKLMKETLMSVGSR